MLLINLYSCTPPYCLLVANEPRPRILFVIHIHAQRVFLAVMIAISKRVCRGRRKKIRWLEAHRWCCRTAASLRIGVTAPSSRGSSNKPRLTLTPSPHDPRQSGTHHRCASLTSALICGGRGGMGGGSAGGPPMAPWPLRMDDMDPVLARICCCFCSRSCWCWCC